MHIVYTSDGVENPATRYRILQFLPHFEAHDLTSEVIHGYGTLYNRVFDKRLIGAGYKVATRAVRAVRTAAASADVVFGQRTAFPQTAWPERLLRRRGVPFIFDFDDAIFLGPGGVPSAARDQAFRDAVRIADHCIAGNPYLAEVASAPHKTTVIPTVIDTERYVPRTPSARRDDVVIGWIGTAGNFPFLARVADSLRTVLREHPHVRVRIVSNATFQPLLGVERVEQHRWSADSEIAQLQSFDIGLMPLENTPLTRGKCAFKMIQYMAVGIPVVVSAVGANVTVLGDAEFGYALEQFDWVEALRTLIADADLRSTWGARARAHAVDHYSVAGVVPRYLELFEPFRPTS